jgi:hypothetical protein
MGSEWMMGDTIVYMQAAKSGKAIWDSPKEHGYGG